jgi:UDP-glucuronate 4-epimerase
LSAGAVFVEGDVCDAKLLGTVLVDHNISRVIHLAAQAGVRHSLDHPLEYVEANIRCFVILLEVLVAGNMTSNHLVYASSSSVYGLNKRIPFSETDVVTNPASLYGVTKASNELMATAYYNLHKLRSVGLRFFTVYGPWGRPDMAYFSFTDDILHDRPITVYNKGEHTRDFTYISDIVDGVIASLSMNTTSSEVVNLGNEKPVKLMDFVKTTEKYVGKPARIHYTGAVKGDVPMTYANIEKARCLLGYDPSTSMSEGIRRFVRWFTEENGSRYSKNQPVQMG